MNKILRNPRTLNVVLALVAALALLAPITMSWALLQKRPPLTLACAPMQTPAGIVFLCVEPVEPK